MPLIATSRFWRGSYAARVPCQCCAARYDDHGQCCRRIGHPPAAGRHQNHRSFAEREMRIGERDNVARRLRFHPPRAVSGQQINSARQREGGTLVVRDRVDPAARQLGRVAISVTALALLDT